MDNYPKRVRPNLDYPNIPLFTLVEQSTEKYPNQTAVTFMGKKLTYSQLWQQICQFAAALYSLGVRKGDRVAIMLPNSPQAVIAYYATMKLGAIVVMVNPLYTERELEHQLQDAGAKVLVYLDLVNPRVRKVRRNLPVKSYIVTSIKDYLPFPLNLLYPVKAKKEGHDLSVPAGEAMKFTKLLAQNLPAPPEVEIDPAEDLALLQYTGGTTGVPKGTMLTHLNLIANTLQTREWYTQCVEGRERVMGVLPFFHVYGMTTALNFSNAVGGELILIPRFDVKTLLTELQKHKVTFFPGAPTIYVAVNNYPEVSKYDLTSIRACISGSAPLPVEVQQEFMRLSGNAALVEGYGLSEASPVTHCNPLDEGNNIGSIGFPFPDTVAKVVDPADPSKEMPAGEVGELIVRGPQVMKGYWNKPEETAQMIKDGWLHTGDMARMDEQGYFYIADRIKDMIISGGFNIYPREVEEVLYEHPKVQEAAVVGIPDSYRGETVKAFLVLREGEEATEKEIRKYCEERLAKYKIPRTLEFRSELPKSTIGKVLKRVLIDEEKEKLAG
ncbi:long-chain-fatty-acid--CoA ligase [Dethiobacter alkaliphilus]|uniref:long-chain-fatty-acid--CoA ligase n=1 Tax=Dethiobacter alkaliphilus TaxID=427926 RepID=UPI0022277C17|nr:long-chain fatty acid--CoA ligase [Dethiobacter alkaliphilus]MCW3491045.1 long-chain fatty acid--CoA ligase [Dethiobacter alkaliphilus]